MMAGRGDLTTVNAMLNATSAAAPNRSGRAEYSENRIANGRTR